MLPLVDGHTMQCHDAEKLRQQRLENQLPCRSFGCCSTQLRKPATTVNALEPGRHVQRAATATNAALARTQACDCNGQHCAALHSFWFCESCKRKQYDTTPCSSTYRCPTELQLLLSKVDEAPGHLEIPAGQTFSTSVGSRHSSSA
jgi:hypothetical protein